ncbi:hypothetical protein, partial [uncultured Amaricoccus sp.]|uniref:hypothetical protein n=1 Tax=uncultured Amaricoccus sp. TaxID=339341 RepID=UPI00261B1067
MITDSFRMGAGTRGYEGSSVRASWVVVAPSAHWFVFDRVSVGFQPAFTYTHTKTLEESGTTITTEREWSLGGTLFVGAAVNVGGSVSVWPRASLSLQSTTRVGRSSPEDGAVIPSLDLFVPVLFHPTGGNIFVGAGPRAGHRFSHVREGASPERTYVGVDSVVGLVLDGQAPAEEPAPAIGGDGQLLLTSELTGVGIYDVDSASHVEKGTLRIGGGAD